MSGLDFHDGETGTWAQTIRKYAATTLGRTRKPRLSRRELAGSPEGMYKGPPKPQSGVHMFLSSEQNQPLFVDKAPGTVPPKACCGHRMGWSFQQGCFELGKVQVLRGDAPSALYLLNRWEQRSIDSCSWAPLKSGRLSSLGFLFTY